MYVKGILKGLRLRPLAGCHRLSMLLGDMRLQVFHEFLVSVNLTLSCS